MRAAAVAGLLGLALVAGAARAEAPHSHGVAKLDIAIEGRRLTLEFSAPLEDIVGFERRPASDKERAALAAAVRYFEEGNALLPSPSAECRIAEAGAITDVRGEGHVELAVRLVYDCAEPRKLQAIEAALLGRYGKVKRIDVRAATPKGQSAARLDARKPSFSF